MISPTGFVLGLIDRDLAAKAGYFDLAGAVSVGIVTVLYDVEQVRTERNAQTLHGCVKTMIGGEFQIQLGAHAFDIDVAQVAGSTDIQTVCSAFNAEVMYFAVEF